MNINIPIDRGDVEHDPIELNDEWRDHFRSIYGRYPKDADELITFAEEESEVEE